MDPQQAFDAVSGSGSSDDAMVSLIHDKKLSRALKLKLSPTLSGRRRMEPLEFAVDTRENIPQIYQGGAREYAFDDASEHGSEHSDDSDGAIVSLIHRKKLSSAFRRQLSTRHPARLELAPFHGVPQFYTGTHAPEGRPVDVLSDR